MLIIIRDNNKNFLNILVYITYYYIYNTNKNNKEK